MYTTVNTCVHTSFVYFLAWEQTATAYTFPVSTAQNYGRRCCGDVYVGNATIPPSLKRAEAQLAVGHKPVYIAYITWMYCKYNLTTRRPNRMFLPPLKFAIAMNNAPHDAGNDASPPTLYTLAHTDIRLAQIRKWNMLYKTCAV